MSILVLSGFETGDFSEFPYAYPGDISVQSSIKKTGTYAARCYPTDDWSFFRVDSLFYHRLSFWFYVGSFPLEGDGWVPIVSRSLSSDRLGVKINSSGQIGLILTSQDEVVDYWNSDFLLSTDTWYRISLSTEWNPILEAGKDRLYVDGVLVCSDDDSDSVTIGYVLGIETSKATCDIYFDNVVYDNTDTTDDIGDIRVLRAGITGAGEYAEFDSEIGSATHFENVDELSYDDADYNHHAGSGAAKESYTLENSSTIGLTEVDFIKAVKTLCRMKRGGGGGTTHNILRRDNGVDVEESVSLGTSFDWESKIDETMPNGGEVWTQDRFDGLEVGASHGGGARDLYFSYITVMVAFGPPEPEGGDMVNPYFYNNLLAG